MAEGLLDAHLTPCLQQVPCKTLNRGLSLRACCPAQVVALGEGADDARMWDLLESAEMLARGLPDALVPALTKL